MIVTCGDLKEVGGHGVSASAIARRAASIGAGVQVIGVVRDDPEGDRFLIELAEAGVGHAAVLREPARDLEPADLDLALRYLPDVRVDVVVGMPAAVVGVAAEHAGWSGTALIVIQEPSGGVAGDGGRATPAPIPDGAIVLEAPANDPDGSFAGFVGALAARLDGGATPADAWAATTSELAVDAI